MSKEVSGVIQKPALESVICQICQAILIKPIRLPCKHRVCLECLQEICEKSNLTCPMCRRRLSIFLRRNKDFSLLIDHKLWEEIQLYFKTEVDRKLAGQDDGVWDSVVRNNTTPSRQMYTPGELNKEYKSFQAQARSEREQKEEEERLQSLRVIEQLEREEEERRKREEEERLLMEKQDEEFAKQLAQMEQDEELAKELQKTVVTRSRVSLPATQPTRSRVVSKRKSTSSIGTTSGSSVKSTAGPLDMFCIRTTSPSMFTQQTPVRTKSKSAQKRKSTVEGPLDRFYVRGGSSIKRRCTTSPTPCCSSTDSIDCELNYFKPIKLVPRTPPKSDGVFKPIVVQPKFSPNSSNLNSPSREPRTPVDDITSSADVEMTSLAIASSSSLTSMNFANHSSNNQYNANIPATSEHLNVNLISPSTLRSTDSTPLKYSPETKLVFNSPSHWSRGIFSGSQTNLKMYLKEPSAMTEDDSDSLNNNLNEAVTPRNQSNFDTIAQDVGASKRSQTERDNNRDKSKPKVSLSHLKSEKMSRRKIGSPQAEYNDDSLPGENIEDVTAESVRNKKEIEHFFAEFKKISLTQSKGSEEVCFSQMLSVSSLPIPRRRNRMCYVQSDDETDVEDFFSSPRKPTVVK